MNSPILQLLVLAGIAIFLILRLRSVLGTREGFEKPPVALPDTKKRTRDFEVIEGGRTATSPTTFRRAATAPLRSRR